jgi:UDP-N-acetylglucosamine 2-epimerase
LINVDTWKLDSVYKAFDKNSNFRPTVVVCPFTSKDNDFLIKELKKAIDYCETENYNFVVGYDTLKAETIDLKDQINADIIFFTNPNNLTAKEFLIDNYLDKLTCFVPYSFRIDKLYNYEYNNHLVNRTWINFYETDIHKRLAKTYASNKGENVIVSGFPFLDRCSKTESKHKAWKLADKELKKIIWAPHWTIKNHQTTGLDWSCFLDYHQIILDLAIEFKNEIQIAIKPHPFLKNTLYQDSLWGLSKTDKYFELWDQIDNCQYVNGDYKQLFEESDALIHDSGSFMTEYTALNKPVAYTIDKNVNIKDRFNEFGEVVLIGHQLVYNEKQFREFIVNVIEEIDEFKIRREEIITKQKLAGDQFIGEKIVNIINKKLI